MDILREDGFFRVLFNAIPALVVILDKDMRIYAINEAVEKMLGVKNESVQLLTNGELFRCIYAKDNAQGCGYGPRCEYCIVHKTVGEALSNKKISRAKGSLLTEAFREVKLIDLLISAVAVDYKGQKLAIALMEDISNITELHGRLPICSSCKRILDEQGSWNILEKYIQEHSEAEFTHAICPDCVRELYPEYIQPLTEI